MLKRLLDLLLPVSYTHLDVYKRQDYEFTEKVISILINDKLNQRISSAARKFVLDRFTWDIAKEQFENILNVNGD